MIKKSSFLFLFILFSVSVSAIELPLLEEEEVEAYSFDDAKNLAEEFIPALNQMISLESFGMALPALVQITLTDLDETFYVYADEEGFQLLDTTEDKADIILITTEVDVKEGLIMDNEENLINHIKTVNIDANTFKGKFGMQLAEDYLGMKLVTERSFTQRIMKIFTFPIIKIFF